MGLSCHPWRLNPHTSSGTHPPLCLQEVPEEALEACWQSSHAAAAQPFGSSSAPKDGQAAAAVLKDQPDQNGKASGRPSTSLLVLRLYRHKLGHLLGDSSTTLCR